eukprot:TRINITY_DN2117_c0_g1_i1.p1 TRINITY_DN2117_c0_g1~~TRINITY_DN2117_c0_g1_i1.p1  ORF type:complete len:160 (-),score=42.34 TRINITY_DN2117_c0_g1_i1:136-615(-)
MSLTPDILWAQRDDSVYLTIDVKEVQDMKVKLDHDSLTFSGKMGANCYSVNIDFFAPINPEESKQKNNRLVEFFLKKKEEGSWTHLRKQGKAPFVKIDWQKWADSDDEGEKGAFNLDGMGDMNFGDMGGDDQFDSDDEEDLPNMEPTAEGDTGAARAEA